MVSSFLLSTIWSLYFNGITSNQPKALPSISFPFSLLFRREKRKEVDYCDFAIPSVLNLFWLGCQLGALYLVCSVEISAFHLFQDTSSSIGCVMRKQLEGRNLAFSVYTNVRIVSNVGLIVVEWLMKCRSVLSCVVDNRDVIMVKWLK